jgi:hypothetical protein
MAHRQAPLATLLEQIRAKPANAWHKVGEVRFAFLLHAFAQMGRGDLVHHFVQPFIGRKRAFDGDKLAVNAKYDGRAHLDVDVRGSTFNRRLQNALKHFHIPQVNKSGRGTKDEKAEMKQCGDF